MNAQLKAGRFFIIRTFAFEQQKLVRRTNFGKKMLIDKLLTIEGQILIVAGATHACLSESPNN